MKILIKKPLISEKSLKAAKSGVYTFLVDRGAKKRELILAIEKQFEVKVKEIKTMNFKIEVKQQRRSRNTYDIPAYKKAIVKVAKGQKIAVFEAETAEVEKAPETEKPEVKEKKSLLRGTKVKIERGEDKV
jgi:large subunit ribosomal protein L23